MSTEHPDEQQPVSYLLFVCAEAVLNGFSHARIRSHIISLAYRQTRDCVRRETCELIATGAAT